MVWLFPSIFVAIYGKKKVFLKKFYKNIRLQEDVTQL